MASTCPRPDTQPASDGRGLAGEQLLQALPRVVGVAWLLGASLFAMVKHLNWLSGPYSLKDGQTRRKSCQTESPGGQQGVGNTPAQV